MEFIFQMAIFNINELKLWLNLHQFILDASTSSSYCDGGYGRFEEVVVVGAIFGGL